MRLRLASWPMSLFPMPLRMPEMLAISEAGTTSWFLEPISVYVAEGRAGVGEKRGWEDAGANGRKAGQQQRKDDGVRPVGERSGALRDGLGSEGAGRADVRRSRSGTRPKSGSGGRSRRASWRGEVDDLVG